VTPSVFDGETGFADAAHAGDGFGLDDGGGAVVAEMVFKRGDGGFAALEERMERCEGQVAGDADAAEEAVDAEAEVDEGAALRGIVLVGEGTLGVADGMVGGDAGCLGRSLGAVERAGERDPEDGEAIVDGGEDAGSSCSMMKVEARKLGETRRTATRALSMARSIF
jgi:hypothetical protein